MRIGKSKISGTVYVDVKSEADVRLYGEKNIVELGEIPRFFQLKTDRGLCSGGPYTYAAKHCFAPPYKNAKGEAGTITSGKMSISVKVAKDFNSLIARMVPWMVHKDLVMLKGQKGETLLDLDRLLLLSGGVSTAPVVLATYTPDVDPRSAVGSRAIFVSDLYNDKLECEITDWADLYIVDDMPYLFDVLVAKCDRPAKPGWSNSPAIL